MRGGDVEAELSHELCESWHLALRQLHDQARKSSGVDDGVLEGALQAAADQPGVEGVAVLIPIAVGAIVYTVAVLLLRAVTRDEITWARRALTLAR